ncbi:MAG: stage III sporulation protein AA [Bacillota bacterium]
MEALKDRKSGWDLLNYFPQRIADSLKPWFDRAGLEEVRLRVGQPVQLCYHDAERLVLCAGGTRFVTEADCQQIYEAICFHSVYAWERELEQGFLTLPGGYRVGMAGRAVTQEGCIRRVDGPTFFNFRIARECVGCADRLMPYLFDGAGIPLSTLILSPPGCGKTTLLRDVARKFSLMPKLRVAVVDERSEIAGCRDGTPQNELGPRCDVLDACPKEQGMMWMVRVMSPDVLLCDELGTQGDFAAVSAAVNCGIAVIASAHARTVAQMLSRWRAALPGTAPPFERYALLGRSRGVGTLEQVSDGSGNTLFGGENIA